jgi:hypothetical protein
MSAAAQPVPLTRNAVTQQFSLDREFSGSVRSMLKFGLKASGISPGLMWMPSHIISALPGAMTLANSAA